MNKKGSILELKRSYAIVMTEDCRFVYVKRSKEMFVGQQINFYEKDIIRPRSNVLKYAKLVACFTIIILIFTIPLSSIKFDSNKKVYAYVDIDINPSLEISISKDNKVLSATSINDDGKMLLNNLKLEGETLEAAIDEIISQSRDNGYIKPQADNYVLIAASLAPEVIDNENSSEEKSLGNLIDSFKGITGEKGEERIDVQVINTNPEIKKQASENSISMGKYYLYLKAKDMGVDFSISDIGDSSVSDIFKKLNMDLIDSGESIDESQISTQSNSEQSNTEVSNDSNAQVNTSSGSAQSGNINSDSNNKSQAKSSSSSDQANESTISAWAVGTKYDVGAVVEYNNNNYKCIQAHTSQADWAPGNVPALWQKQVDINESNTWQTAVSYSVGTIVTYNGIKYKCIQEHMSMQGYEPPNTPALWQKQ